MQDWRPLTMQKFEEYLFTDAGPHNPLVAPMTTQPADVTTITTAVSAAILSKPPASHTDMFMKNKCGGDDVKVLKEMKQWNTWQQNFL